eukprot:TRINITY_DN1427_c0_g1_i5.p1 TRINITY_DN1427_c0_g1~~TRINITY_DN1427_c0_g1_i5.p1  ORF type:complete len:358 (+),score=45.18 TRINITY_DN1427_c0_g1_i5:303-1376(+)
MATTVTTVASFQEQDTAAVSGLSTPQATSQVQFITKLNEQLHSQKNGLEIGTAFREVNEKELYPCIGLRTRGEKVKVNFGTTPFTADFSSIYDNLKAQSLGKLMQGQGQLSEGSQSSEVLLATWVLDYLIINGHYKTAQILARDHLGRQKPLSSELEEQQKRRQISEAIISRNVDQAMELINFGYPNFFKQYPSLLFKMKFMKLLNIVFFGNSDWAQTAINYAKQLSNELMDQDENKKLVQDAMVMIAYKNPIQQPFGQKWLKEDRIKEYAQEVNVALIREGGGGCSSMLDTMVNQCLLVQKELLQRDNLKAQLMDVNQIIKNVCQDSAPSSSALQENTTSQRDDDSGSKQGNCRVN